jgi:hypothetical protein
MDRTIVVPDRPQPTKNANGNMSRSYQQDGRLRASSGRHLPEGRPYLLPHQGAEDCGVDESVLEAAAGTPCAGVQLQVPVDDPEVLAGERSLPRRRLPDQKRAA